MKNGGNMSDKKRLVTRSDFDGLVCAMILRECNLIEEIKFVHPKDVQDGKVELSDNDITTNLPYNKNVFMCFDHHESELTRNADMKDSTNWFIEGDAKSAARVVYNYYKNAGYSLDRISDEIMTAVDKGDSADFTKDEILDPKGWVLMNFLMDARTGLGRFHNFRISNYDLMMELIDYCINHSIDEVLQLPDVKERVDLYNEQSEQFKKQLKEISHMEGKVVVVNQKAAGDIIYAGNRFMIYALFPEAEISIHVAWGFKKQNTAVMIGKSIINKVSKFNIGEMCLEYGGGGHANAGTCQIDNDKIDQILPEIIDKINNG